MLIKVFSLKFDGLMGCFDDTPIRDFTQDKEVLQVRDHLLIRNEIPYLVLVIKYYPFRKEAEGGQRFDVKQAANAWKKEIAESDFPLFNRLRDWRSERCKKEGIPPYLIFTNQQLALIVKKKPQSLSELVQIEGIGRGKSDRYGVDVLAITMVPANG
jgi:superfamily II DNA helicase RecQ